MKYTVTINGKKYEVIVEQEAGGVNVSQNVAKGPVAVSNQVNTQAGEETVTAPMPGTILKIKVREGQAVKKGDVLFILEAMKMENEIMAGRDGVVSRITVSNGAQVTTGDCLAVLK